MSGRLPELLTVSIPLGPLTYAIEASPDVFHLQDPKTKQFHALPMNSIRTVPSYRSRVRRMFASPVFALLWRWIKLLILAIVIAAGVYVLAKEGGAYKDDVLQKLNQIALAWTTPPIAEPVATPDLPPVAQEPISYPMPLPMSVVPDLAVKSIGIQDTRDSSTKAKERRPVKEESLIVMNESLPELESKKSESSHLTHSSEVETSAAPANVSANNPPPVIAYKPQLVAIQDETTILVTSPTSRMPVRVSLGSKLPDGRVVTKIDVQSGVVSLESGALIRLE